MQLPCFAVDSVHARMSDHLLISGRSCDQIQALQKGAKMPSLVLAAKRSPLQAIDAALRQQRQTSGSIRTLHLLAHGRPGAFRLGDRWIDADALKAHARELAQWEVETIVLWSCHVGADVGFVALLEELTGARVLASVDWLGRDGANERLQLGEWQLSDLVDPSTWPVQFRLEDFDDELTGTNKDDQVDAGAGDDDVDGGAGDDVLDGGMVMTLWMGALVRMTSRAEKAMTFSMAAMVMTFWMAA